MSIKLLDKKYYFEEGFMIYRNCCDEVIIEDSHSHDFVEIVYVYGGFCDQNADGKTYRLSRGDLLFLNYGINHSFVAHEGLEYVNILIKPDYISRSLSGIENAFALLTLSDFKEFSQTINTAKCYMHFNESECSVIEELIALMQREFTKPDTGNSVILRSGLDILLTLIFRKMSLPMSEKMNIDSELLEYIKENCGHNLTAKKVAAMCFYNPSYFSRAFKKYTAMGFNSFLTQCRIDRACRLLMQTDMKIDSVAEQCGFSDRTRFFKLFTERVGCSPLKYRKSKK